MIVAEAGAKGAVTIATNMAGRGTDIKLGGNPDFRARRRVGSEASPEEYLQAYEEEYAKWKKDYDEVCALGIAAYRQPAARPFGTSRRSGIFPLLSFA